MKDLAILNQLLNYNHLEPKEVERAEVLLERMTNELNSRIR